MSDRNLYGAPYREECVAAVQQVLADAGLSQMLNSAGNPYLDVDDFVSALSTSGYSETSSPVPGDIVDLSGQHVGIYLGGGEMLSNGSTSGLFDWEDSPANENASEGNGPITYYHHN
jgi:cell wall-associated NlpC family hydrolase